MRTLLFSVFALATISLMGQEAEKRANLIMVKGVSFDSITLAVLDKGFFIDKKDDQLKTIVTIDRPLDNSPTQIMKNNLSRLIHVVYYVRLKDSTAYVTGKFNAPEYSIVGKDYEVISNRGMAKSVFGLTWQAMVDFATSFKGNMSYGKTN